MEFIKKIFGERPDRKMSADRGMLHREIQGLCADFSEDELKLVTGYAGLLGRVAYADMEFSSEEAQRIERVLQDRSGLSLRCAVSIVALLNDHRVQLLTIEEHLYARLINEVADKATKLELVRGLFQVAAADDSISLLEDSAIGRICDNLHIARSEYVELKREFKEYLAVLHQSD